MPKGFNTTAGCLPEKHYMVNLDSRLQKIKQLIEAGKYFAITRARQYGKTTILRALYRYMQNDYYVVFMDFQTFSEAEFRSEAVFANAFAASFIRMFRRSYAHIGQGLEKILTELQENVRSRSEYFTLKPLFELLSDFCTVADKPVILMIDEVDSASNNQVFLDFLAQLRAQYIDRDFQPAFQSVILAGVYDIKNLKRKLRTDEEHKLNSPWNIAADFSIDMSFSKQDICGMLMEYEADYHTGMDVNNIAGLLYAYTAGYPFLVSRLCQLLDEVVAQENAFMTKKAAWTKQGLQEAVKLLLAEKNTLFDSLFAKVSNYPELDTILKTILFTGKSVAFNPDENNIELAVMFGFIKNNHGVIAIANRIFETRLYNYYLSTMEMQSKPLYKASLLDKNNFIINGHLNMRRILEKFVEHFHDLYGDTDETFIEEEGRKYFLLYLRPIINGTGNYYIEAQTREQKRTDVIVDYNGEQFIIEMKIWHEQEYNSRGEKQLLEYLDAYHINKGYMLSFNFNKNKRIGVHDVIISDKLIVEAVV